MEHNYDKDFLEKYMKGGCSEEEKQYFHHWLDNSKNNKEIQWMRKIWEKPDNKEKIVLGAEERILQQILEQITENHKSEDRKNNLNQIIHKPNRSIWLLFPLLRYASIILTILIPLIVYKFIVSDNQVPAPIQLTEKTTHNGQHLTFGLEDGTQVTLNSNSQLIYPVHFDGFSRNVTLNGEAFFDVAKDSKRPFTVTTGVVATTVLGTSFNILFPKDESLSRISLISGSVKVEVNDGTGKIKYVQLIPGEQLLYRVEDGSIETSVFDQLAITGWKDGTIYFKEAGIEEIIKRLEVWYDVEIEVTGNLEKIKKTNWNYTGIYENQNLENVLRGISYVKNFSFEINDKNVKLMFN